jgi:hypothetical protein
MPIDKKWREGAKVDKSGLWIKMWDNPYGDAEDCFHALYFQETRLALLDDDVDLDAIRKVAPQLIEEEDE